MSETTRAEHLQWCKDRALEYADVGDLLNAFASMVSDLGKHRETAGHVGIKLGTMEFMGGFLNTPDRMRHWIEGFN